MKMFVKCLMVTLLLSSRMIAAGGDLDWPEPVIVNRPGTYWWWMGSAVDKENITKDLEALYKAGLGGVTIIPIYGVKGYEKRYLPHLSPQWLEMMTHAVREGNRLGMWVDMTPGTGWPFGGPLVSDEDCDATVSYRNGKLSWGFSGRMVKRAAPGGEGKAINPYSSEAIASYLKRYDEAFKVDGILIPRAMYHDSFEYRGNWHRNLPEAFQKLRGYDLLEHLPELFGEGDVDVVARIKSDYRETLSDLHLDYMQTLQAWAESKNRTVRNEAHGSPSNLLDLYAASGIPETEIFGASQFQIPGIRREANHLAEEVPQPLINRMASSAAHIAGRPLVASESCTWIRNHFHAALSQIKPEIDQLFLCGINHVFLHGTCFSPQEAAWPGWLFYASLQYNPRNTIWRDAPELNAYITRCQSILQSGQHDNEIILYWPVYDLWHNAEGMQQNLTVHDPNWMNNSECGETAKWLIDNGYGFDFVSDRQLLADKAIAGKAVIVPKTSHLPLATLKKLLEIADRGQTVLFLKRPPDDVPGYQNREERQLQLRKLLEERKHLVINPESLKVRLESAGVIRESMVDLGLDFARRTHEEGHHYFIANMGNKPVSDWTNLGVSLMSAVVMDPRSGETGVATIRDGRSIFLQLQTGETRIVRTFQHKVVEGPGWPVLTQGKEPAFTFVGPWGVRFIDGGPELPQDASLAELKSWTELDDKETDRFAGTARYTLDFDLAEASADDWMLDLGEVRESARVVINGQKAASLYSVPFRSRVGQFLKPGHNRLEIEVTNLSANRIRDLDRRQVKWKIFRDLNFVDQNYQTFDASNWELEPSGLLGPVTLTPMKTLVP